MAASPVLLVADDLAVIASVKRVLAREGYECVLATNAADAIIGWGHSLPGLVLLQPSVEGDRGQVVLEELAAHPEARLLRVVLLGESVPGFPWPVEPLPLDPQGFAQTVADNFRSADRLDGWTVLETTPSAPTTKVEPTSGEPDAWRAAPLPGLGPDEERTPPEGHRVEAVAVGEALGGPEPTPSSPSAHGELHAAPVTLAEAPAPPALEDKLFGDLPDLEADLHREVEAQAMASVESSLAGPAMDDELQRLEDEVRAEAQRRREAREEQARAVATPTQPPETVEVAPALPPPSATLGAGEDDFSELGGEAAGAPAPPPSRAAEMLARAEQLLLEGRAAAEARRREAEAAAKKQRAELEAAERRVENAEALVRRERELRAAAEGEVEQLREQLAQAQAEGAQALEAQRAESAQALDAEAARRAEVEAALAAARAELERVQADLAAAVTARDEQAAALEEATVERDALSAQLESDAAAAKALEAQRAAAEAELAATKELVATRTAQAEAEERRAKAAEQSLAEAVEARDEAREQLAALAKKAAALEADLGATTDLLDEATQERDQVKAALGVAQGDLERTIGELERALQEIAALTRAAEETRQALDETKTRAEAAEARAAVTQEKVHELELRAVISLALPGRKALGVPRTGVVDLDGLASLVGALVLAQADGRLELGVPGGTRTLWFKRGAIIGAESTLEHESLIDRARRDGLIDARQEAELRMMKTATPREQLDALKARGAIRDIETVPLVQRATEQTALEAFTEPQTNYRFSDEPPSEMVLKATLPRPTLPMLAESLRRAVPPDALLEKLGGGEAVPVPTNAELDLRALGFSERERKMLTWVDGEATVEDLSLASGLKPDDAFRALLVAKLLGLVQVKPPAAPAPKVDAELDVRRLDAKFDEVQDADYFTILGLPRTAGADDVQRAFQRLGGEFDPLRFSGHPDPSLQQRAQVVYRLLEEAARALKDDRRRAEYARHLLD